ncbi:hypothetical protein AT292_00965 (plasmid) [Enterobacter cloacae]|nr:hypothetical protein AT292_00965 [Enterobacter cloacae]
MVNRYQFRLNILDVLSDEATRLLITVTDLNLVQNTFDPIQLVERSFNLANIAFATTVRADINVIEAAIASQTKYHHSGGMRSHPCRLRYVSC